MKKALAGLGLVMGSVLTMGTAAFAQTATTTPLDGVTQQANDAKDQFSSFVTGTGVPILFGLLILGVGISLAIKYVRRGARAA